MKTILIYFAMVASAFALLPLPGQIHLSWLYSSNTVCTDQTNGQMDWFYIRGTNVATTGPTNWPVVYGQPWTNIVTTNYDGTNFTFIIPFTENPAGEFYFASTYSNFWGESAFSNVASTPPLPSTVLTHIFPN